MPQVGVSQDFFLDLGGHSLIAAKTVALLRERADEPASGSVTALQRKAGFGVALVQALLLVASWYVLSTPSLFVIPIADDYLRARIGTVEMIIILYLFYLALTPVMIAAGLAAKWLIVGRYKAGVYPLWGSYYIRCWLQRLFNPAGFIGTPLLPLYYRLMGARVGRNCTLDSGLVSAWDLISIGSDASIGADTQMQCARIQNGYLILGRVDIGSRCFVGAHSAFGLNVRMSDDSRLDDQSLLPDGGKIRAGERCRARPRKSLTYMFPRARSFGRR